MWSGKSSSLYSQEAQCCACVQLNELSLKYTCMHNNYKRTLFKSSDCLHQAGSPAFSMNLDVRESDPITTTSLI